MALQMAFTSPYSASPIANAYWRITELQMNFVAQTARVVLSVYESQAARNANKLPIGSQEILFTPVDSPTFLEVVGTTRSTAVDQLAFDIVATKLYGLIKLREGFESATDA